MMFVLSQICYGPFENDSLKQCILSQCHACMSYCGQIKKINVWCPTYFSECSNYFDGEVLANNPCEASLAHLQESYQAQGTKFIMH